MQPSGDGARLTHMMRTLFATLAVSVFLVGCGSGATDEVATDPPPSESESSGEGPSVTPTPTDSPTVGTYPDFAPDDYAYTLVVSCFCPDTGIPVRVTVIGGEAVEAVYAKSGRGVTKGEPAPEFRRVTIDEVIEAANDTGAAVVKVKWPDGQDYPSAVSVDQDELMADEEIGYALSDVVVG